MILHELAIIKYSVIKFLGLILILVSGCEERQLGEMEQELKLEVKKLSSKQLLFTWNSIEGADEFKIWRVINSINSNAPELIEIVDPSTLDYVDDNLPQSPSLTYYITTNVEGKEKKSNEVEIEGAKDLPILPYQMELIPGKDLAIVRDYSDIFLVNYERRTIVKKLSFQGKVGQMDLAVRGGTLELFVPCTDNNIYILNALDLTPVDTIEIGRQPAAVVVNSLGKIFCSGNFNQSRIRVYDRGTLSIVSEAAAENNCGLALQNDNNLVAVSKHLTPATMSYYTFNDEGFFVNRTNDPYGYDYEMESDRLSVSSQYIVTSRQGFIYKADQTMTYLAKITHGGSNMADFEFSADGNTIYSTVTTQRTILRSTVNNGMVTTTAIPTQGYPWILARDGNMLVVLSSPVPFSLNSTMNSVIIEKITVQ